jgi:hypothetical protein
MTVIQKTYLAKRTKLITTSSAAGGILLSSGWVYECRPHIAYLGEVSALKMSTINRLPLTIHIGAIGGGGIPSTACTSGPWS